MVASMAAKWVRSAQSRVDTKVHQKAVGKDAMMAESMELLTADWTGTVTADRRGPSMAAKMA